MRDERFSVKSYNGVLARSEIVSIRGDDYLIQRGSFKRIINDLLGLLKFLLVYLVYTDE